MRPRGPPVRELHEEFEACVETRIATVVLARWQEDADLAAYFATGEGIRPIEAADLLRSQSFRAPFCGVVLAAADEKRVGSVRAADLETRIDAYLLMPCPSAFVEDGWLKARITNRMRALCQDNAGVLEDGDGLLTSALSRFQTLTFAGQLVTANSAATLTRLTVVYTTEIDEETRGSIE